MPTSWAEMALGPSHQSLGEDETRTLAAPSAPLAQPGGDLRLLGEALSARAEDVLVRVVARTHEESGESQDDVVRESFEQICLVSTVAVAEWMSGGNPEAGREAGREAWNIFGGLVARQAVPLNEATKRCLRWRDAASDVVRECAGQLGISPDVLAQALGMLQLTLDVTLVRMCKVFESERQRAD